MLISGCYFQTEISYPIEWKSMQDKDLLRVQLVEGSPEYQKVLHIFKTGGANIKSVSSVSYLL